MARRIFRIVIAVSVLLGIYLFISKDVHSKVFSIITSSLTFLVFSFGIHGLIAYSLHPKSKGNIIVYPILMWALWAVLFLLFVFFVIPFYCPDFLIDI